MPRSARAKPVPDTLGPHALNRALLARQLLLRRAALSPAKAIEHLIGLQAQAPDPPYVGLWTRLEGFTHGALARLVTQRRVVRIALMRSTIHLVTARDCLALRPVLQPMMERALHGSAHGRHLKTLDVAAVAAAGRALVEERARTFEELGKLLRERWLERDAAALAQLVRTLAPLVQVPPRGLWGCSGPAAHTTAEAWLGKPLATETAADAMLLRYLAAFGPASVRDAQQWSGLTRLAEAFERLRPRLRTFRDTSGRELFDLPRAPRPDPETPAPVRFLAEYDNAVLAHADRTRIVSDEHRTRIITVNGLVVGTVLLDGFVRATWRIKRTGTKATLHIESFGRLSPRDRVAAADEGARLLAFAAADAVSHDVRFTAPR